MSGERVEFCPQCGSRASNTIDLLGGWLSAECQKCGWDSKRRPRLYSPEEAQEEIVAAARDVLNVVHRSTESSARNAAYLTPAEELRQRATAIERKDATIQRLQWAIGRVDAMAEHAPQE